MMVWDFENSPLPVALAVNVSIAHPEDDEEPRISCGVGICFK
jgi:hypothetical protein